MAPYSGDKSGDNTFGFTLVLVIKKNYTFLTGLTINEKRIWNYFHLKELHYILHDSSSGISLISQ